MRRVPPLLALTLLLLAAARPQAPSAGAAGGGPTLAQELAAARPPDGVALAVGADKFALPDGAVLPGTRPTVSEVATVYARVYRGKNPRIGQTVTLVFDMAKLAAGGDDWTTSRIEQIRLQTDDQPGGEFVIREAAISQPLFR